MNNERIQHSFTSSQKEIPDKTLASFQHISHVVA